MDFWGWKVRKLIPFFVVLVISFTAGCQMLGLPEADTFNKKVTYAIGLNTGYRDQASVMLSAGTIDENKAREVLQTAKINRQDIEALRALYKTDPTAAENRLDSLVAVLKTLRAGLGMETP